MVFSLSRDIARPRDQKFILLYGYKPVKVSHHPTKVDGHKHCGSGDIMVLICLLISQDIVVKWLCDIIGSSP